MPSHPTRVASLASMPSQWGFLTRLFATFAVVLAMVGAGLYLVQSADARRIAIADGAERHLERGQVIEDAFESVPPNGNPWGEVRRVLAEVSTRSGVRFAAVVSPSGRVVAASDTRLQQTTHSVRAVGQVIRTGDPAFQTDTFRGREVFEYLAPVRLGGAAYVFEVEQDPVLLNSEISALTRASLKVLGVSYLLSIPLLYLLGGRVLADRFSAAKRQAALDGLTGLHNYWSFRDSLDHEVARARRFGESFTLVLVDIDDFKLVNDSRGHQAGDGVLVSLAAALSAGRAVDRAFRIGGDEFAVIMPRVGLEHAVGAVEHIRREVRHRVAGTTISVGLAAFDPADADADASVLRDQADLALYEAKRRGRDEVVTFAEIAERAPTETGAATIVAVRHLLTGRQMGAAFQPIWNLDTHRVFGYEGLARPAQEYGLAGPQEAFSGAARLGRVDELDALCRESVLSGAGGLPDDVLLFLNVAPGVLAHDGQSGRLLQQEVEAVGLDPGRVVVELTQRAGERMDLAIAQAQELRSRGFRLALDHVGSGESRLGVLGALRPDYIKVDRGVVRSAREGGSGRAVLAAIVAYAAESGEIVIAEGIETEDELNLVGAARAAGGRARFVGVQGFLLGRPHPDAPWRTAPGPTWPPGAAVAPEVGLAGSAADRRDAAG